MLIFAVFLPGNGQGEELSLRFVGKFKPIFTLFIFFRQDNDSRRRFDMDMR
jgi:hypothetical protein